MHTSRNFTDTSTDIELNWAKTGDVDEQKVLGYQRNVLYRFPRYSTMFHVPLGMQDFTQWALCHQETSMITTSVGFKQNSATKATAKDGSYFAITSQFSTELYHVPVSLGTQDFTQWALNLRETSTIHASIGFKQKEPGNEGDLGEQEVLGDQRNVVGSRRQNLGDEQQEHDEGEQDRYAHGDLLTCVGRQVEHGYTGATLQVCRQVEHGDADERDEHARDDEVDGIEQSLYTIINIHYSSNVIPPSHSCLLCLQWMSGVV